MAKPAFGNFGKTKKKGAAPAKAPVKGKPVFGAPGAASASAQPSTPFSTGASGGAPIMPFSKGGKVKGKGRGK